MPKSPDLILLLLRASQDERARLPGLHGITRLEKLLFLADRETQVRQWVEDAFEFKPYNFGPYSKDIYEAVEFLEEIDLLREERRREGETLDELEELDAAVDQQEGIERSFYLTDKGKAVADLLASRHPEIASAMAQVQTKYGQLPLRRLIRDVYGRYPEMATESLIKDRL